MRRHGEKNLRPAEVRRHGEKNLRPVATWQQGEKNLPLEPRDDLRREALGNRDGDLGRRLDVI